MILVDEMGFVKDQLRYEWVSLGNGIVSGMETQVKVKNVKLGLKKRSKENANIKWESCSSYKNKWFILSIEFTLFFSLIFSIYIAIFWLSIS